MAEPRIRFKRPDGKPFPEWTDTRFGDVFTEIMKRTSDTNTYPLYSLTIENGVTAKTDRYERSYLVKKEGENYKIVPPKAFVYNPMNLRFGALAPNHEDKDVCVSQYYNVFTLKDTSTLGFWENYLVTDSMLQYYFSIATGSLIEKLRVHYSTFVDIVKPIPCIEEQQQIADFLSSVDGVITTSEQEVANLETQKKAVMKKIFSQEVRFKRTDGSEFPEWEALSFENSFEALNNNTFSRDMLNYNDGPALNIHYGDILVRYGDVCDIRTDRLPYVNEGISVSKYAHLQDGDIVLADTAEDEAVGKAIELINVGSSVVVSGLHTMVCRPKKKCSPKYLGYFMNSPAFHNQLKPYMQGIKVTSLGRKNIKDVSVMYPSDLDEQRLIAEFLSNFDEAIAAAKRELELWKELKKGLLQQMFV